jgi:predicted transcriptional regulator
MRLSRFAWLLGVVAITAGGCSASKEDVMKKWKASEAQVTSFTAKYAVCKDVITKRHKAQKGPFDTAAKGKGDVDKMKAAMKPLSEVLDPIAAYERMTARINELMSSRKVLKHKGSKVRPALAKARKKLAQAAEVISKMTECKDAATITKTFGEANGYLKEGLDPLERLARKGKKKKRKKRRRKRR